MTDSLKNLASSVDWKKLLSSSDAKNALIGSALGGLMLGGASLASDRDPEESKWAPVGDALMGAVLGGAAGYGIPKGLALFRDSGSLAPDDDQLHPSYFGLPAKAFGYGAVASGASAVPAVIRAQKWLSDNVDATFRRSKAELEGEILLAEKNLATLQRNGAPASVIEQAKHNLDLQRYRKTAYRDSGKASYQKAVNALRGRIATMERAGDTAGQSRAEAILAALKKQRKFVDRGHSGWWGIPDAIRNIDKPTYQEAGRGPVKGLRNLFNYLTRNERYIPGKVRTGRSLTGLSALLHKPGMNVVTRVGKVGAGTAAAALALQALLGVGTKDNFKN